MYESRCRAREYEGFGKGVLWRIFIRSALEEINNFNEQLVVHFFLKGV